MKAKTKLAIFASGTGSNFHAIQTAIEQGTLDAEVVLVVSDQANALVLEKAKAFEIETFVFDPKAFTDKQAFETKIIAALQMKAVAGIILAGYMRLIGPTLLRAFQGRIINIHPSLLPSFKGLDAIGQAFDAGVKITGVTIHYVDAGMDTGRIIAQACVQLDDSDTKAALQTKIQQVEHRLYPETIQTLIAKGEFS